tara:strand:- start:737 stop:1135 length:399 start_codon:yes stop_codon:yes gene_type:complete
MSTILNNPTITVNNVPVPVKSNTSSFIEGLGEQTQIVQSTGGGNVTLVFSDNIEMKKSKVKWTMLSTVENIEFARQWKILKNSNAITLTGVDNITQKILSRTFTSCAFLNQYEINLKSDGDFEVEFEGATAV